MDANGGARFAIGLVLHPMAHHLAFVAMLVLSVVALGLTLAPPRNRAR